MNHSDIQKLLGGYATGTLTDEEQQILFEAALNDQELFDALAREQALRDLLRDPGAKAQLLAALDDPPAKWYELLARHWRPASAVLAMAGVSAIAVIALRPGTPPPPVIVAQVTPPPASSLPPAPELPRIVAPPAEPKPQANPAPERRTDSPVRDEEKGRGTSMASLDHAAQQAQLAKLRTEADLLKQKSDKDAQGEVSAPASRAFNSGFRAAAPPKTSNVSGYLGGIQPVIPAPMAAPPPPPPPAVKEMAVSKPRENAPASPGGIAAGLGGSVPSFQAAPTQQGQQGAQVQQQQQPAAQQQVQVQSNAESISVATAPQLQDTLALQDARSLYYQNFLSAANEVQADTKAAGPASARKKAEQRADQEKGARDAVATMATNATAPAQKALQALDRATNPGVRYTLMRAGSISPVDDRNLKAGDRIYVVLQPNDDGNLAVRERRPGSAWQNVMSMQVEKGHTYPTRMLSSDMTEVEVTFVRNALSPLNARGGGGSSSTKRQATSEPATYVVGDPSSQRVTFTIPLNYK